MDSKPPTNDESQSLKDFEVKQEDSQPPTVSSPPSTESLMKQEDNEPNETITSTLHSEPATEYDIPDSSHLPASPDDAGHATDSTLSDGEANGNSNTKEKSTKDYDTEPEISDVESDEENITVETSCKWQKCELAFDKPSELTAHILEAHIENQSSLDCQWESCSQKFGDKSEFVAHIRRHTQDYPYFCADTHCSTKFLSSADLLKHIKLHNTPGLEENAVWQTFLTEIVSRDYPCDAGFVKESIDTLRRFRGIDSAMTLQDHVQKPKIDFLKIQNVQVDDIVSEPNRKKGRTANSVINAELRTAFHEIDNAYTEILIKASNKIDNTSIELEELPTYETINSLKQSEELKVIKDSLSRKLVWGLEVQSILKKDLDELKALEDKLWSKKELLLQANIDQEISHQDQVDNLIP